MHIPNLFFFKKNSSYFVFQQKKMKYFILLLASFYLFHELAYAGAVVDFNFLCLFGGCNPGNYKMNNVKFNNVVNNPCSGSVLQLGASKWSTKSTYLNNTIITNTYDGLNCQADGMLNMNTSLTRKSLQISTDSGVVPTSTNTLSIEFEAIISDEGRWLIVQADYGVVDNTYRRCKFYMFVAYCGIFIKPAINSTVETKVYEVACNIFTPINLYKTFHKYKFDITENVMSVSIDNVEKCNFITRIAPRDKTNTSDANTNEASAFFLFCLLFLIFYWY